jgi:putative intracellular protease/amidase
MNICVFYYDDFCEFEVVLTFLQFRKENTISVALENRVYISEEKQRFLPDKTIEELNPEDIDLFIIPGGNPSHIFENMILRNFLIALNEKKKYIAGICGGTELMARYGILDDKNCTGSSSGIKQDDEYFDLYKNARIHNEDIVIDGNLITSTGQAFIEFSVELGKLMNQYKTYEEAINDYKWLKNIKN